MAKPREILKTRSDELVLEKLFNEFIVPWYREHAITPVIYDKARKELEELKASKTKGIKKGQKVRNIYDNKSCITLYPFSLASL